MTGTSSRTKAFQAAIAAFIEARREDKLKGKEDASNTAKFEYRTWLADAAHRAGGIQMVTHVLKATHPAARGSSLYVNPADLPTHLEVGSHMLGGDYAEDVVCNAAALGVFKLLKVEVEGRRLLDWMREGDVDLRNALDSDVDIADTWMTAFSGLVRKDVQLASHGAAKQLYWCVGEEPTDDKNYHLLQPLFSSSLAHAVHVEIHDARFGDENKAAKQAFRANVAFTGSYRDYRGLAMLKLGGTKPQNISQLNSERGGVNYLLSSLPPRWRRDNPRKLLGIDSVLESFAYYEGVRGQLRSLMDLLLSNPNNTMGTRLTREAIEQDLGASLAAFGLEIRQQSSPGWTCDSACRLPLCEQLWLDPERPDMPLRQHYLEEDTAFNQAFALGDWPDQVAGRFANWINARLHAAGLTAVGDAEYRHWGKQAILAVQRSLPPQRRVGGQA